MPVHPCRSGKDTGGNPPPYATAAAAAPKFKMHACDSEHAEVTLCGLGDVLDVGVVAGYTSLCKTCFPRLREEAWTAEHGDPGDPIGPVPAPSPAAT
jgi:hypothetical protein